MAWRPKSGFVVGRPQHGASVAMVPPPWSIVSPKGVIHVVADDKALRALAKANPTQPLRLVRSVVDHAVAFLDGAEGYPP